jgi:Transposase
MNVGGRSRIVARLTRWLERQLLTAGEELVRVSPKLMAPERRAGRARGKSDAIDALAVARAALREPDLSRTRSDEEPYRELKLLVDHRDAIVDERRRVHQRLRWHLYQLDPTFAVPLRMLARKSHLERVSRWLARQDQELQVRLGATWSSAAAGSTARSPSSTGNSSGAPRSSRRRCLSCPVAARSPPRNCSPRSALSVASKATRSSLVTAASRRSKRVQAGSDGTASTAAATDSSTPRSTESRSPRHASTPAPAPTSNANAPKAKAGAKRSAASNDSSSASSSTR